jgi:hypothetical protein
MRRHTIIFSLVLIALCISAHAQISSVQSSATAEEQWQEGLGSTGSTHGRVAVITLADPKHRVNCHVESFTDIALTCKHGKRDVTYKRDKVAAIILPQTLLGPVVLVSALFGVAGGSITGIYLLASVSTVAVVAGGIPLGLLAAGALIEAAFAIEGDCGVNIFSSHHDKLVYQSPGLSFAVKLR